MKTLATSYVQTYPIDRPPQLRFLAGLVNEPNETSPGESD